MFAEAVRWAVDDLESMSWLGSSSDTVKGMGLELRVLIPVYLHKEWDSLEGLLECWQQG